MADVRITQFIKQVVTSDATEIRVTNLFGQVACTDNTLIQVTSLYGQVATSYNDLDEPLPLPPAQPKYRRTSMVIT